MNPKVSVIMPVLNGQRFIRQAIESILAQTYPHYELVIVDDGSTDATAEIAHTFADRMELRHVYHTKPRGIAPSMNDGVRNATGDMIAFLDHDDYWFPDFLQTQVSYLREHQDVGMVHSDFQTVDVKGNILEESVARCRNRTRPSGHVFPQLFLDSFIVGNSVLIRRECFDKVGNFDESLRWGDYHLWMRIARQYKVDYVGQVLTCYRQHPTQSTRTSFQEEVSAEPVGLVVIRRLLEAHPDIQAELGVRRVWKRMASLYFDQAYLWFAAGAFTGARHNAAKAIRIWPWNLRYYLLFTLSLLRPSHASALRRCWRQMRGTNTAI